MGRRIQRKQADREDPETTAEKAKKERLTCYPQISLLQTRGSSGFSEHHCFEIEHLISFIKDALAADAFAELITHALLDLRDHLWMGHGEVEKRLAIFVGAQVLSLAVSTGPIFFTVPFLTVNRHVTSSSLCHVLYSVMGLILRLAVAARRGYSD